MNYDDNTTPYAYGQGTPYTPAMAAMSDPPQQGRTHFAYPANLQNALNLIQKAVAGETEDRLFYTWLIDHAPAADKPVISGIRDNEISHYAYFHQLYRELTGRAVPYTPGEQFVPPATYCEGLSRALMGEQAAVQKYRQILYAMQTREHFNMLTEIITDEIRHGILYSHLYSRNGCRA